MNSENILMALRIAIATVALLISIVTLTATLIRLSWTALRTLVK